MSSPVSLAVQESMEQQAQPAGHGSTSQPEGAETEVANQHSHPAEPQTAVGHEQAAAQTAEDNAQQQGGLHEPNGSSAEERVLTPGELLDRRRVKVYKLSPEEDKWRDIGTGQVSCSFNKILSRMCIRVKAEDTDMVILESRISERHSYTRQGDTIITWEDGTDGEGRDLAVSFQEAEGCASMWEEITQIQQKYMAEVSDFDYVQSSQEDEGGRAQEMPMQHLDELPPVSLAHLDELAEFFGETMYAQKDVIAGMVIRQDFLPKLLDLFKVAEDMEDLPSLHKLFKIMRGVFLLNDSTLLEHLLNNDNYEGVFGILEYDQEVEDPAQRIVHRKFLKESAVFKNVASITCPVVLYKIHLNFRIMYLKDVALARYLDEITFNALNSISYFNNTEIVIGIQNDQEIMGHFFRLLQNPEAPIEEIRDLALWLQELCTLSRPLGAQERAAFWRTLCQMGIFSTLENVFWTDDAIARNAVAEIMMCSLVHDGQLLRSYLLSEEQKTNGNRTLRGLVETITVGKDVGMKGQMSEMLRMLMDPESLEGSAEKDDFLNIFYENLIDMLVKPLVDWDENLPNGSATHDFEEEEATRSTIMVVIEVLAFCVTHHGYRIKYFLIRNQVLSKVLRLVKHREKVIQLCAIRFIRTCIGLKDDFYHRCIIKDNLLEPIMEVFTKNGNRYNLLNSAVIELFEFIKNANIKKLVEYAVDKFGDLFRGIDYVDTFHTLLTRFEQNKDADMCPLPATPDPHSVGRKRARLSDEEQEDYFSKDDEDEGVNKTLSSDGEASGKSGVSEAGAVQGQGGSSDGASVPKPSAEESKPLVAYGEDDDEEFFGPPPPNKANGEAEDAGEVDFRKLSQQKPVIQGANSMPKRFKFHF